MDVQCFFLERTNDLFQRSLRRSTWNNEKQGDGPCRWGHDASAVQAHSVVIDPLEMYDDWRHDDPLWPKKCERCEYVFKNDDKWHLVKERLYIRSDTKKLTTIPEAGPGAMYYAPWLEKYPEYWKGSDGHILMVICPDGHTWNVDSRCSNCTMPDDNAHRCWIRHGTPPNITVDKVGNTCRAGGGSINTHNWHGFLRDGKLVTA